MKKQKFMYVVTMYRWGSREAHSYVLGVFQKKYAAIKAGISEYDYRGCGKYEPEILEIPIDKYEKNFEYKTIEWQDKQNDMGAE
jgi:hypothetical protein